MAKVIPALTVGLRSPHLGTIRLLGYANSQSLMLTGPKLGGLAKGVQLFQYKTLNNNYNHF